MLFSFDYDKGYIQEIQPGGYLFVTLEHFCYRRFNKHGDIAYFAYMF